ncbi:MAG TPA: DUF2917 domain-containing protein [Casimicrobiaceae bacterium]|nr:DUF2917 domain-containing protein [Casimicrobiaceae bacterium]
MNLIPALKQIYAMTLAPGAVLRIRDAKSTRVAIAAGRAWITEENVRADRVLRAGTDVTLVHDGLALVAAVERSRVVLETPRGVEGPRTVELAPAEGEPSYAGHAVTELVDRPPIPRYNRHVQERGPCVFTRNAPCEAW